MPPAEETQLSLAERDRIINWIEKDFLAAQSEKQVSSAPVVIRRLNRQEYDNTIRDLLGLNLHLADNFPADDIAFGFDNVGSALNISPIHVEKYLAAAATAVGKAIVVPDAEGCSPIELIGLKTYPLPPDKPVEFKHTLKPGRYLADFSLVRVGIAETVPPPRLVVGLGKDRRTLEAVRVQDETVVYRFWMTVTEGDNLVHVSLAPGQADSANVRKPAEVTAQVSGDQRYGADRGLHVDSIVVRGPVIAQRRSRFLSRIGRCCSARPFRASNRGWIVHARSSRSSPSVRFAGRFSRRKSNASSRCFDWPTIAVRASSVPSSSP